MHTHTIHTNTNAATRPISECAVQGSALGLGPGGIAGAVIGTLLGLTALVLLAVVPAVIVLRKKR